MIKHKGVALVLVLWVLSLLTIMAGSFALGVRRETAIVGGLKNNALATATAESGIAFAQWMLLHPDLNKRWRMDGSIYHIDGDNVQLRIRLLAETGKINLNTVDQIVLQTVLAHAPHGADAQLASTSINRPAALLDWRDTDDLVRINGAEKAQYQEAGLSYQPSNQNFQSLEEVAMVLGIDAETYHWLEPLVSVYSPHTSVNLQVASKEVLQLLLGNTEQVARYIAARTESAKKNLPLPPLPSGTVSAESAETTILTVISEARLEDKTSAVISVVLKKSISTGGATPFQVLNWQQNPAYTSLFADNMNDLVVKRYAESELNH